MPNGIKLPTEDFEKLPIQAQRTLLYENLLDVKEQTCGQIKACDERFAKIENRKWWSAAWSAIGGVIGGAAAVIGKMALFK